MFWRKEVKETKVVDETRVKELEQEIKQIKKDFESDKKILERQLEVKVSKAIEEKEKEVNTLTREKAVLTEKVNILEKAFENMGFDVKDMKEILNKLVDGVVSKNTINVVK